ncbi:hypothetical protein [Kineosporia sp. NBRC 101731]|uniref:hypothetical protein n=1 Tax=Kineosporia sp. NBRC 101731 TaxID=3032199 RepID=UPI0024A2C935|nr:hypothetical protein [Kineosporia sp. NBRC 101731]GLY32998.1 hypothetical protein Kisp02_63630 [Kineosporia sp. NBRC 101731]
MTTGPVTVPPTEELSTQVRRILSAEEFRTALERDLLDGVDPEIAARVFAKADGLRRDVLGQVDNIPMEEELQWTIALSYMELKAQWLQRQVRVCYEEMMTGSCSKEVALEASAASYLISLIEPLLDAEHLRRIRELFVSQVD